MSVTDGKGGSDYYAHGDWNTVCYECGRKKKASSLRRHWQGYYVCPEHWEPRQPQDFVRGTSDNQAAPWTQPMPAPVWVPGAPDTPPPPNPDEYPLNGDD